MTIGRVVMEAAKLTAAQKRWLLRLKEGPREKPHGDNFGTFDRVMGVLVERGLARPFGRYAFEITGRGQAEALLMEVDHYRGCRVAGCERCYFDDPGRGRLHRREATGRDIERELMGALRGLLERGTHG